MTSQLMPLPIDRLPEIDSCGCEYNRECAEIMALVGPNGPGSFWPDQGGYSVHLLTCSAWRRAGCSTERRELVVHRPVKEEDDWFSVFPQYSIHRMKVLLSIDETRAIVVGDTNTVESDDEFDAIAKELKQPVVISTPLFGDLSLDRKYNMFDGKSTWNDEEIDVTFKTDETLTIDRGRQTAEALWADQVRWKRKVEDFAVEELLPIKNELWLEEGERPLTADQFKSRMSLEMIAFYEDGRFEFGHADGDLFWGHSIQVSGSLHDGLTHADIPG